MPTGEIIARIISETLGLLERLMEEWVNLINVTQTTNGNVTWYLNISLSPHGETFVEIFDDFVYATLGLVANITSYLG